MTQPWPLNGLIAISCRIALSTQNARVTRCESAEASRQQLTASPVRSRPWSLRRPTRPHVLALLPDLTPSMQLLRRHDALDRRAWRRRPNLCVKLFASRLAHPIQTATSSELAGMPGERFSERPQIVWRRTIRSSLFYRPTALAGAVAISSIIKPPLRTT